MLRPPASLTADVTALHVGTLGLVIEPAGTTIERLVARGRPSVLVMLDPNGRPSATRDPAAYRARIERIARRADVVKVSEDDLALPGPRRPARRDDPPPARARRQRRCSGRTAERPWRSRRPRSGQRPGPAVEVVDTVGAGDAFGGGFLAAWIAAGRGRATSRSIDHVARRSGSRSGSRRDLRPSRRRPADPGRARGRAA